MENINQICRKIIQGPQNNQVVETTNVGSGFLAILATMNQTIEETSKPPIEMESQLNELIKHLKSNQSETEISPELVQILMNQMVVQVNQNDVGEQIPDSKIGSVLIQADLEKPVLFETKPIKLIEIQSKLAIEFVIPEVKKSEVNVVEVIREPNTNEIQKHYKAMNQPIKIKESLKLIDQNVFETNYIKPDKVQVKENSGLNETDLSQFKQSIEEMHMHLIKVDKNDKENETMVFKLKPEGLAEIVVKFEQKFGKVTLDISTSNKYVEQLIQKELPQLKDVLKSYQMDVNLNEMSYHDQTNQSHQFKSNKHVLYQMEDLFEQENDEAQIHEWIDWSKPNGLNTYV